jgi:hypothetical protein
MDTKNQHSERGLGNTGLKVNLAHCTGPTLRFHHA